MEGQLDFKDAFRRRLKLLEGTSASNLWSTIIDRLELTDGAEQLAQDITNRQCHSAIISGGFIPIIDHVRQELQYEGCHGNQVEVRDGIITGEVIGEIVDGEGKQRYLVDIQAKCNIPNHLVKFVVIV